MATSTSLTIGSQGTELLCTASWNRGAFIRAIGSGTVFTFTFTFFCHPGQTHDRTWDRLRARAVDGARARGALDVSREHSGVLGVEMKTLPVN